MHKSADLLSLNYFVSHGEQLIWNIQIKRFCSLPIDHKLEFRRLLNRQLSRVCPLEDFVHIEGGKLAPNETKPPASTKVLAPYTAGILRFAAKSTI